MQVKSDTHVALIDRETAPTKRNPMGLTAFSRLLLEIQSEIKHVYGRLKTCI
jgi:hypothetical protein